MTKVLVRLVFFFCFFFTASTPALASELNDLLLSKIIEAYQLEPLEDSRKEFGPKERLGRALFFDPILSGPRSVACAACHLVQSGTVDDLRVSVGVGATGIALARMKSADAFVIPRNALPLFDRANPAVDAFFWDGRVQLGVDGSFESPLGSLLPEGFENLLAVASVFPLAEADEMLGRHSPARNSGQGHGELLVKSVEPDNYQLRTITAFQAIVERLVGKAEISLTSTQKTYRTLFKEARGVDHSRKNVTIADVGNALSAYIAFAFASNPAAWDRYIAGDKNALSAEQKEGAILFYGNGRCAICHQGKLFSDFRFHGLAVPQSRTSKHGRYRDFGRAAATGRGVDRYTFRTPPLRQVSKTGPWGHNGAFESIGEVVEHHFNPIPILFESQRVDPEQGLRSGRLLMSRSKLLGELLIQDQKDIVNLGAFLESIDGGSLLNRDDLIPNLVPSGNGQFIPNQETDD